MKRILIIKPSSLGDVLHAFPAVYKIMGKARKEFPKEEIFLDWVISPAFTELLDFLPFPGRKILFDRKKLGHFSTFPKAFLALFKALREEGKYDAVYDLQGLLRSALIGVMAPSSQRFGSLSPREKAAKLFYSQKLDPGPVNTHAAEKLLHMVNGENRETGKEPFLLPVHKGFQERAVKKAAENQCPHLEKLSREKRLFALSPGARWESKEWSGKFFSEACKALHKSFPEAEFLLLGSPGEREKGEAIRKDLAGIPCHNLIGATTIGELVELIRYSTVLLCNDSGPMHIGAFCNTPVVALFGPTDPLLTGPFCAKKKILKGDLPCQPCFKRSCPEHLKCQEAIAPSAVEKAVKELLAGE